MGKGNSKLASEKGLSARLNAVPILKTMNQTKRVD